MLTSPYGQDKRDGNRYPLIMPVQCSPLGSEFTMSTEIELWTNDVHQQGVGLNWYISSRPQTCPVCESMVRDLNCIKLSCPYRHLKDVLLDSGWLRIQGLDHVPGWDDEKKVLGKVVWFRINDNGINFQFGVKFNRGKPPIQETSSSTPPSSRSARSSSSRWTPGA